MYENFRYPGEFEKVSDVFMSWIPDDVDFAEYDNRGVCVDIIKALQGHAQLHINCGAEGVLAKCRERLEAEGVDMESIIFTQFDDTSFYVRDNGPNFMIDDNGNRLVVNPNWSYYGVDDPETESPKIARRAGVHMAISIDGFDIVSSKLVSEGGDREFNGAGVLMAIEDTEVRKRNPDYTKEQVEEEYKRIYNLEKILWVPKPLIEDDDFRMGPLEYKNGVPIFGSSFAAHIDEMCRFVGKNKILMAEVTDEEAAVSEVSRINKERLAEAYEVLSQATDAEGNPFEIVRMPAAEPIEYVITPEDEIYSLFKSFLDDNDGKFWDGTPWPDGEVHFYAATGYCNFLICNDVVLGQKYYSDGMPEIVKQKDERAEAILNECFPERKVIMINTLALNLSGGGIHCWTKEAPAVR